MSDIKPEYTAGLNLPEPLTFGDLKWRITHCPFGDWPSRLNPLLTHTQALAILMDALADRDDHERLSVLSNLLKTNVLRECRVRRTDCG